MNGYDAATLPDTTGLLIVGPDHWRFAQVKDWILLCADIPHVDVRVYGIFRTLAAQAPRGRRLSKDEVRWLLPGVNGKPMSMRTLEESLRRLADMGLVIAETGNVNARATRNAAGRWERVEALLWRVNELPAEGTAYTGWHTVQEGLDAYPGPGWEERVPVRPTYPEDPDNGAGAQTPEPPPVTPAQRRANRARKTAQTRTRSDQAKQDVPAGGTVRGVGRKSAQAPRKSADRARKSSDDTRRDQAERDLPDLFTDRPYIPTPLPPDTPDTAAAIEEHEQGQAGTATIEEHSGDDLDRARTLIADFVIPAGATPPTSGQTARLAVVVCDLWALGASSTDIRATATRKTDDARWAGSVWLSRLEALAAHRRTLPARPARPARRDDADTPPPPPSAPDAPARVAALLVAADAASRATHRSRAHATGKAATR